MDGTNTAISASPDDPNRPSQGPAAGLPGPNPAPEQPSAPIDDSQAESGPAVEGTRFERIRQAGRGLFAKWGLGRQKEGLGGEALGSGQAGGSADPGLVRDSACVRRTISSIAKALRKFADKIVFRKALEASGDKAWARQVTEETSASDDECDAVGDVTDIVLKELGIQETKYLPLIAGLTVVAGCGARYVIQIRALDRQIKARDAHVEMAKEAA